MTVASTISQKQYTGNGSTTQFTFPNKVFSASDLVVTLYDTNGNPYPFTNFANGVLALTYTVQNVDVDTGCIVVFSAPVTNAWTVDLRTVTPLTQSTSIKNQGTFLPELHEEAFDRSTRELQDLVRLTYTYGIHGSDNESTPWPALPPPSQRLGAQLVFDPVTGLPAIGVPTTQPVTANLIGSLTQPQTSAEAAASVAVTATWYEPGNILRYGIVPNSPAAAAANTAILQALLNYNTAGPTGYLYFPNTTGSDVYSFTGVCTVRQFLHIDLGGCTISVTGASSVNDVNTGFFYGLSDFIIENGTITTAVDTTLGVNAAACIQVGARGAGFYYTVYDSLLAAGKSQGRVTLRNLVLNNNNTGGHSSHVIAMTGGLSNVQFENITINCNNVGVVNGIYYEWGWATSPSGLATTQTSHGHNLSFKNIRVLNAGGAALGLTGAYNAKVDGLFAQGCAQVFVYSVGEAMFYNPWVGVDQVGAKRNIDLKNIAGQTISGVALQLSGSNLASGTYLSGAGLTPAQQTDLMSFTLDGFAVSTLVVSGNINARNGKLDAGGVFSNPLTVNDDCMMADFTNVNIIGGTSTGVRANIAGTGVWSPVRQKFLSFRGCLIAGNVGSGLQFGNVRAARLTDNRIGYNSLEDAANESVQTVGVSVGTGCQGIICDHNFVTTSGGNAYDITGTTSAGCNIVNPLGTLTAGGNWDRDGVSIATGANMLLQNNILNTNNKYFLKQVLNNSTNKVFLAQGPNKTDPWISVDGAVTIQPA